MCENVEEYIYLAIPCFAFFPLNAQNRTNPIRLTVSRGGSERKGRNIDGNGEIGTRNRRASITRGTRKNL